MIIKFSLVTPLFFGLIGYQNPQVRQHEINSTDEIENCPEDIDSANWKIIRQLDHFCPAR
jgi:hypothetical protein